MLACRFSTAGGGAYGSCCRVAQDNEPIGLKFIYKDCLSWFTVFHPLLKKHVLYECAASNITEQHATKNQRRFVRNMGFIRNTLFLGFLQQAAVRCCFVCCMLDFFSWKSHSLTMLIFFSIEMISHTIVKYKVVWDCFLFLNLQQDITRKCVPCFQIFDALNAGT